VDSLDTLSSQEIAQRLAYVGFVLTAYELVKSMIVGPIKTFYADTTFAPGPLFKSYQADVRSRHANEFEACLLYLRDFMGALDSADLLAIQALRQHRNDLAHELVGRLADLRIEDHRDLLTRVDHTLNTLSTHRLKMDVGADPEFRELGLDWDEVMGHEYWLFSTIRDKVALLGTDGTPGPRQREPS
jgi:hypothetical protein